MDALALLCNLYGDGPSTLKRLRAHGVQRIEDLGARSAAELGGLLALSPPQARRFIKEAASLEKRVLVQEGAEPAARSTRARPRAHRPIREARAGARGKEAQLAAAAKRWSELDRAGEPAPDSASGSAPALQAAPARRTALTSIEIDRATYDALHAIGLTSLEELVAGEGELFAGASGLGLSQVLFVQGLARRKLREQGAGPAPAAPSPEALREFVLEPGPKPPARFSPSERPPDAFLSSAPEEIREAACNSPDEGAGPFA